MRMLEKAIVPEMKYQASPANMTANVWGDNVPKTLRACAIQWIAEMPNTETGKVEVVKRPPLRIRRGATMANHAPVAATIKKLPIR